MSGLTAWLGAQIADARHVRVDGLDRVVVGHSAETFQLAVAWRAGGTDHREEMVIRLRPQPPGLLEPYDLKRQFDILRALEPTPVRAPRALWFEGSGTVLGREFYVMERAAGHVYEGSLPDELAADPERVRQMSGSMIDQFVAIHGVDLGATGLDSIGDGRDYLDRELGHWTDEIIRVRRGPLPALERLVAVLRDRQPEPSPRVTLVHGDPKPGNFAFLHGEVSAVFDWEMAAVGDPLADVGWAELMWKMPGAFTGLPGALSVDEFVARYEHLTGIAVQHRAWYRAFQALKMAVILLVGGTLFDRGFTDDVRFADMTFGIHPLTRRALRDLGIDDDLESGCVTPRRQRVVEVLDRLPSQQ